MPNATSVEIKTKSIDIINVLTDDANIEENKVEKIEMVKADKITMGYFFKKLKMSSNDLKLNPLLPKIIWKKGNK
jgi:type IV secretory pathway component VirB8